MLSLQCNGLFTTIDCCLFTDLNLLVKSNYKINMKASIVVILLCMFTGSNARSSNCPTPEWFAAEYVCIIDQVVSASVLQPAPDSSLSFFREVMLFTEEEIVQVTNDAIQFYNTRFGLDFSQSEPNELGQRFYQNATFFLFRFAPELQYTITFNRWIVSGNTRSVCFENRAGNFMVTFSDQQILHGTYGGEDGIPVASTDNLVYGFHNILICPQEPLVIQYNTATPARVDPHDGFQIANFDLFHRILGHGLGQGVAQFTPTEDGRVHFTLRNIFTFPAHPSP